MTLTINASVGRHGKNQKSDVVTVQELLTQRGFRPGIADCVCGKRTEHAIETFQHAFLKFPDARIDPGGLSWKRLTAGDKGIKPGEKPKSALTKVIPKPKPGVVNVGLQAVNDAYMLKTLGSPRKSYSQDCQPVEDAKLKRNMVLASVGPFKVQGLNVAVESLKTIMSDIQKEAPAVYLALGSAGMLCCRYQRDSKTSISNHSWGTAIDLTIDGVLDKRGDNLVQTGLAQVAHLFNRHGWCWGATFKKEDAMHFEAGLDLVAAWATRIK